MSEYDGKQFVGIDLHRQRSVIVRQTDSGEQLAVVRIVNDPASLALQLEKAGEHPEVVLEATYGWYVAPTPCRPPVPRCTSRIHWVSRGSGIGG
ncbi:hypothetical protein RW1_148_00020 [Rhodococcus wratislaviensis NBRC 100605]|uniref:Uncharacterized protein n=1 Tax=Rhodococcus wratislaviensis NBRC 100605 TaxID=1219028 RepID=X0QL30_RHOWR|nr:hypothetical protein [Rhodococcus wratislaviensis]GAF51536.1 hypothetical protein RW1_148_00020 [Rhodococcus wratislaviensis NBRC 100605]